jgi:hypothetical protein
MSLISVSSLLFLLYLLVKSNSSNKVAQEEGDWSDRTIDESAAPGLVFSHRRTRAQY